jgi:BMFP domain-containing protein YqiC
VTKRQYLLQTEEELYEDPKTKKCKQLVAQLQEDYNQGLQELEGDAKEDFKDRYQNAVKRIRKQCDGFEFDFEF